METGYSLCKQGMEPIVNGDLVLLKVGCMWPPCPGCGSGIWPRTGWGWRPVLLKTYVNPRQHQAARYLTANWQLVGETQARGARGKAPAKLPQQVSVLPLHPQWKRILAEGQLVPFIEMVGRTAQL